MLDFNHVEHVQQVGRKIRERRSKENKMIRICSDKDKEVLLQFLKSDPLLHTYIIADMERYGFDKPYQSIYMIENESFCEGVFLKYYNNLIFSKTAENIDPEEISRYIFPEITNIMGELEVVKKVAGYMGVTDRMTVHNLYAQKKAAKQPDCGLSHIRTAGLQDVDVIYDFLMSFPEFRETYARKEMIENRIEKGEGIHILMEKEGKIIAHGNSAASTDEACFLGGICVAPGRQKNGYAAAIVQALCTEIHKQHRIPCMFAPEEKEYTVFHRLGFEKYGKWGTIQMKGDNR